MRILVRAPNWLGDAVMCLPAVRALRERCAGAGITVLARSRVAGLFRREPCVDRVLDYRDGGGLSSWRARLRLARDLRGQFDWAILLPGSLESALVPWLAGIPRRTGYDRGGRSWLLTEAVPLPARGAIPPHQSYYYLDLIRRAGLWEDLPSPLPILLSGIEEARARGRALFSAMAFDGAVVGISPGAQNSRAKQWPPDRFVEAARRLAVELGAGVAIFGSANERELGWLVSAGLRRAGVRVLNLAGETSLEDFIATAAACAVFLSNDSGAMHVASALDVPTVAVFGPTEWFATGPVGPRSVIVREPVECSPCMLRDCPTDHRCMLRVTPERVARAGLDLLEWKLEERGHARQDSRS
ncbi:MAG: lipopolysaccharide heptosyltransferase II [Bryobacterales bacterium]|nr:lipopolysaccharide heptosyltransferase II [Bryobacteraceae bacterium]MDW8129127.1 lipopolysaccharide heptosyltransferase II [Bryobacterales bacterium]